MFTARYVLHSTFCPHSVFMCFVWIWEQTAIIALYSTDWLVFITETECVYCAVRAEYLYTTEAKLSIYTMKKSVFDPRPIRVRFVVYKVTLGLIFFPPSPSVLPCRYHSANSPCWSLLTCCSNQKDKRAKPGDLQESEALLQIAKNWMQNDFHYTSVIKETAQRFRPAVANSHARDFNPLNTELNPICQ